MRHSSTTRRTSTRTTTSSTILTKGSTNTLRVVAPATLEEGYQFDVLLHHDSNNNNKPYTVTVPKGGVKAGQEFEIPLQVPGDTYSSDEEEEDNHHNGDEEEGEDERESSNKRLSSDNNTVFMKEDTTTKGRWRRSLCACCDVLTQATFWMGFVCTPILIAQLLTRLGLDWKGRACADNEEGLEERALTFNRIVLTAIAVLLLGYIPGLGVVVLVVYWLGVVVWIGTNVRRAVRQLYQIPTFTLTSRSHACCCCTSASCTSCQETVSDCICMALCGCCSAIQMARQTHDDHEYPGYCSTTTGLPPSAPKLV